MSPLEYKDISVQEDGLKIGWNIMATLVAMGIGLYVHVVLLPIKNDIDRIKEVLVSTSIFTNSMQRSMMDLSEEMDERIDNADMERALTERRLYTLEDIHKTK